ncbi:hypothetical protein GCM10010168_46150 [Actinoplanes ianthinogenes]|uniref:YbaB/EbfC DNA-binding family protein n=1 Tax=Actinoplanes ianthinogenes TaxID=122358 RepID=A0ABM7LP78_9ACTN|nr:hypothetical protein [Actinoplanes ianthinogenes]BCJ41087.1 hypothetical protein Aiant_17440 [Actinoplanes ianthinogenes]GGR22984.1 hypothetical protein GCM10010168_46150 [Actinoplanes ianthinogenes]
MSNDFEPLAARAAAAMRSAELSGQGEDDSGAVLVRLDGNGRVASVRVTQRWRERVAASALGDAVVEAVRAAGMARFAAWGATFADGAQPAGGGGGAVSGHGSALASGSGSGFGSGDFARELSRLATRRMSSDDSRVALSELLAILEDVEQGLDQALDRVTAARSNNYTGHSPRRDVTVTVTGGGEVSEVRYHSRWLAEAHEANIGRQTVAAFQAAYALAARDSVDTVIAESRLGAAQRAVQDPFELATRLRLR